MPGPRIWSQEVVLLPLHAELRLTHPDGRSYTHLFSLEHMDRVSAINWHATGAKYASAHVPGVGEVFLHAFIMHLSPGRGMHLSVDHINRDTYDSRDQNLRVGTSRDNLHNMSKQGEYGPCIRKIYADRGRSVIRYQVGVSFEGIYIHRPSFEFVEQAFECRYRFFEIVSAYENGERLVPTRSELKNIADDVRSWKV